MKKFVWMMACALAATSVLAQDAATNIPPATATTNAPATPPAKKATKSPTKSAPKKTADKKADKKKAAPTEKAAVPAAVEKPIVLKTGPATITGDHVNVRGQATFVGEIVKRLNKGETVNVLEQVIREKPKAGEPTYWAKISYPKGANVWVHNTYISNNVVVPKKLNVRAGPGENYSVVGVVDRGTAVKEVSRKANWVEIEAPAEAYAFLAAKYLHQEGEIPVVPTAISVAPDVKITPASQIISNEVAIATQVKDDTTNSVPVLVPDKDTTPAPPPVEEVIPRVVSHEGVVRPTISIQAPTKYEIWDPKTRMSINYLHTTSTNLNLAPYKGLRIIVTGEESLDERWKNTPVISIQKIQVVE